MTTEELKQWVRIYAVEILTVNNFAAACLTQAPSDPLGLASKVRQQMITGAKTHAFPGVDAAMFDLASAELEDSLDRLMEMANAQITTVLQHREGS